jgi:hypothetical protein
MGNFSGLISGYIIESLGSHLSLFIASACVWIGLFSIWLIVVGIAPYSLPGLCCSIYIAQFGGSLTSQTSSSTSLSIFPSRYQFKIASIAKGYSGIAGAIIPALAGAFFESSPPSLFILFSSVFMPISIFAGTFAVKDIPPQGSAHFKDPLPMISQHIAPFYFHFFFLFLLSVVTALLPRLPLPYLQIISKICGVLLVAWLGLIFIVPQHLFTCQFQQTWQALLKKTEKNCSCLRMGIITLLSSCCSCNYGREKYSSVPDSSHSTVPVTLEEKSADDNPMFELRNVEEGEAMERERKGERGGEDQGEGIRELADDLLETDSPMPTELPSNELSLTIPQSKYPDYTVPPYPFSSLLPPCPYSPPSLARFFK